MFWVQENAATTKKPWFTISKILLWNRRGVSYLSLFCIYVGGLFSFLSFRPLIIDFHLLKPSTYCIANTHLPSLRKPLFFSPQKSPSSHSHFVSLQAFGNLPHSSLIHPFSIFSIGARCTLLVSMCVCVCARARVRAYVWPSAFHTRACLQLHHVAWML